MPRELRGTGNHLFGKYPEEGRTLDSCGPGWTSAREAVATFRYSPGGFLVADFLSDLFLAIAR
jgi:hypothetical protein